MRPPTIERELDHKTVAMGGAKAESPRGQRRFVWMPCASALGTVAGSRVSAGARRVVTLPAIALA
ncbi:hypothetical protein FBQ98_04010 [Gammaproteobacteria bacterium PRO6]|nr:hypothetical protein [Gammaproteobacteria bacterium PRO6]